MIVFDCPCCASALQLADYFADKAVRCPECRELLRVPAPVVLQMPAHSSRLAGVLAAGIVALLAAMPVVGAVSLFGQARPSGAAETSLVPAAPATLEAALEPTIAPRLMTPGNDTAETSKVLEPPAKENSHEPLR
jgi:hypothetical protein